MTPAEHKSEAERLIALALETTAEQRARDLIAAAQVHATLALFVAPVEVKYTGQMPTRHPAQMMPAPRGGRCALGCSSVPGVTHGITGHDEAGCTIEGCECPAPFGRIMPQSAIPDDPSSLAGDVPGVTS